MLFGSFTQGRREQLKEKRNNKIIPTEEIFLNIIPP